MGATTVRFGPRPLEPGPPNAVAVRLFERATRLLDEAGLEARQVRPAVLVPLLEGAARADHDRSLHDRWAALLANAATSPDAVPPSFPYILGQLDSTAAKLLDACFDRGRGPFETPVLAQVERSVLAREAAEAEGIAGHDCELALHNLLRLRLLYPTPTSDPVLAEAVMLTRLGYDLVRACTPPRTAGADENRSPGWSGQRSGPPSSYPRPRRPRFVRARQRS